MLAIQKSSEIRSNFGSFIDNVFRQPMFFKRRNSIAVTTSKDFIEEITVLKLQIVGEADDYVATLDGITTVAGYGTTVDIATKDLAEALKEYVELYFSDLQESLRYPNLRSEFFIVTALQGKSSQEIEKVLNA